MKKIFTYLALLSITAFPCLSASTPEQNHVSQRANWVAHVDFQSILNSKIGSSLMAEAQKDPKFAQQLNGLKAVFGLDLEKLGTATAYGSGKKDEGIIIAHGGVNSSQLEGFASLNENVVVQKKGDKTLYSFKKGAFCTLGPDSVMIASNKKLLDHGLDVLSGESPAQKSNPMVSHLIGMVQKPMAIMTVQVPKVLAMQGRNISVPEAAIIKKADMIGFAVGETGSTMRVGMVMRAENEKTAEHLENVVRGAASLLALGGGLDKQLDEVLAKITTSVSRKNRIVGLQLEVDSAFLLKKITEELEKKKGSQQEDKTE
jgi:hypothetical protein